MIEGQASKISKHEIAVSQANRRFIERVLLKKKAG
jgi:hypothetical protein